MLFFLTFFSRSSEVRRTIDAEGVLSPLINILKSKNTSQSLLEKVPSSFRIFLEKFNFLNIASFF